MNIKGIIGVILMTAALAVSMTACGSTGASQVVTPVKVSSPVPACVLIAAWATGGGLTETTAIESDLSQSGQDADAGNLPALEFTDGPQLTTDAATALADPMPGSAGYVTAMTGLVTAGEDMTAGDVSGATAQLVTVTSVLNSVTANISSCNS